MYSKFFATISWVSNSNEEANAIDKNWTNCLLVSLPAPWAMFEGIETMHRLDFEVKPKSSSLG